MPSNPSKRSSDAGSRVMPHQRGRLAEAALTPLFPAVAARHAQRRQAGPIPICELAGDVLRIVAGLPPLCGYTVTAIAGGSPARRAAATPVAGRQAAPPRQGGIPAGRHKAPTGEPASTKVRVGGEGTPPRAAVDLAPAAPRPAQLGQRHGAPVAHSTASLGAAPKTLCLRPCRPVGSTGVTAPRNRSATTLTP